MRIIDGLFYIYTREDASRDAWVGKIVEVKRYRNVIQGVQIMYGNGTIQRYSISYFRENFTELTHAVDEHLEKAMQVGVNHTNRRLINNILEGRKFDRRKAVSMACNMELLNIHDILGMIRELNSKPSDQRIQVVHDEVQYIEPSDAWKDEVGEFMCVIGDKVMSQTKVHKTHRIAEIEATRLAKQEQGRKVSIVKVVGSVTNKKRVSYELEVK